MPEKCALKVVTIGGGKNGGRGLRDMPSEVGKLIHFFRYFILDSSKKQFLKYCKVCWGASKAYVIKGLCPPKNSFICIKWQQPKTKLNSRLLYRFNFRTVSDSLSSDFSKKTLKQV